MANTILTYLVCHRHSGRTNAYRGSQSSQIQCEHGETLKQQEDLNKRCFPPVVDAHTRLLILGSLPGDASLAQQQYYAHPQNRFWHLLGDVLNVNLLEIDYQQRLKTLLKHHIGLWDVVAQAKREGSLDSKITERDDNDLLGLLDTLPHLRAIAFNGGTAHKIGLKILGARVDAYQIYALPSSSPAYTLPYSEKLKLWQILRP